MHASTLQSASIPGNSRSPSPGVSVGSVYERYPLALAGGVSLGAAVLWIAALASMTSVSYWLTPRPQPQMHLGLAALPPGPILEAEAVSVGNEIYRESCVACHGPRGLGLAGLGKDLVHSDFVAQQSDRALADFINRGRLPTDPGNTTGVSMPPKGGNPTLADQDLLDVVAYLRGLQDPRRVPESSDTTDSATTAQTAAGK